MNTSSIVNKPAAASRSSAPLSEVQKSIHVKNLLVPVDFSELSLKSLHYAIPLARQYGAKITLLYVVEPLTYAPEFPSWMLLPPDPAVEMRKELNDLRKTRIPEDIAVEIAVSDNFVPSGVIEAARASCADLIVITTHGRTGLGRWLQGSACEKIVRLAPCPVLVLHEPENEFV
jgi:nucleotide-binding universal stress UspA family protein